MYQKSFMDDPVRYTQKSHTNFSKYHQKTDYSGVQRINNVFHKVENIYVFQYIRNLIDNVEYVVYVFYSSILNF
jgi:hypothetical protein